MTTEDRDSPEEEVPQQARHELDPEALGAPSVQLIDQLAREAHTDWELAVPAYERPAEERALNLHGAEGLTRAVTAPTAATAVPGVSDPMVERPPAAASTEHVQPLSEPELQRIAAIGPAASEPPSLTSAPPPTFYFLPDASGGRPPATSPPGPATPGEASRLAAPAEVQSRVDGSLVDRVSPGTPGMDSRSPARPAVPAVAADAPREDEIPKADLAIPNERAYLPVASSELDALEQAIVQHLGGPMTRPPDTALPSPGLDAGQFARMPDLEMTLDPEKVGALAESHSVTLPTVGTDPWLPQDLDALRELSDMNLLAEPHLRGVPQQTMEPGAQHVPAGGTAESFYFVPDPAPATPIPTPTAGFNVDAVRRDFPILQERINGRQLAWLDNAATTQKPRSVIQRLVQFYEHENSNVHRAAHTLAARSTNALEGAREKVQRFLGANSAREIVFVRGTTEGINLVAQTYGRQNVHQDDEIILTELEHHSNIVPWQHLAREKGARIRVAPIDDRGEIILSEYEKLFSSATKLVCVSQVSNALGTVVPVKTMIEVAQRHGVAVLVDGAQSVGHMPVNVQALGCDFFIFSGHKLFAPTGIGAVWAKAEHLEEMPPWQGGGNMIDQVTFDATTYADIPAKFEAGTGIIGGAVGLGAAIDYLGRIGFESALRYEHELLAYAHEALRSISGLRIIGQAAEKAGVISFVLDGMRSEDVGPLLDNEGIAVRAGHHCAQPALRHFGLTSTVRPSLAFYNTRDEIDRLVEAVHKIKSIRS